MSVASASKWMYAAYVADKLAQYYASYYQTYGMVTPPASGMAEPIPPADVSFLTMTSGYHSLDNASCENNGPNPPKTPAECLAIGDNEEYTPTDYGNFWYDSAHFEVHATLGDWQHVEVYPPPFALSLSNLTDFQPGTPPSDGLADELNSVLGLVVPPSERFDFSNPLLAAGIFTTADVYTQFLRKILNGELQMSWLLGAYAVPAVCADGTYNCTPVPATEVWHYSLGHWVEDDPNVGDGAFSSGGAYGFYPWIWLQPRPGDEYGGWVTPLYGVVARDVNQTQTPTSVANPDSGIGWPWVLCGRAIRKAFLTNIAQ